MKILLTFATAMLAAIAAAEEPFHGRIDRFDPAFDRLIARDATLEKLAEGVRWAEGPVWYEGALVLSDPPANVAYHWRPGAPGLEVFLKPSGGQVTPGAGYREPGSNGLALDRQGRLLLCQDGERRVARYEAGKFTSLADRYEGKRFNSPNDLAVRRNGDVYFTDPPYGLEGVEKSPLRELPFCGVYRVNPAGQVTLLTKELAMPNGIAFSPDESTLYVNVTDRDSRIMAYPVQPDGTLGEGRRFFDRQSSAELKDARGGFDGLKVDRDGNLWSSGPGGIVVISPAGKLLGRLFTGVPTANCAWGEDGGMLYITANHFVLRVRTLTKGAGW